MKINSQLLPIRHSHPWVALKNLTFHTIYNLWPVQLFPKDTCMATGEFKIGLNKGKIEIYENKFSTPSPFVPPAPG